MPQLCPHCARPCMPEDPLTWMGAIFRSYIPLASSCCEMNYFGSPPLPQSCCHLRSHHHVEPWPLPQLCPPCARPHLPEDPLTWMEAVFRSFIPLASSCCKLNYFCAPLLPQRCCRLRSHHHVEPWPLPQLCPHCARPRMPEDPLTWMEAIFRSFIPLASSCCEMNHFCAPPLPQRCCHLRSHRHIEPWPLLQLCPHCAGPCMPQDPLTWAVLQSAGGPPSVLGRSQVELSPRIRVIE